MTLCNKVSRQLIILFIFFCYIQYSPWVYLHCIVLLTTWILTNEFQKNLLLTCAFSWPQEAPTRAGRTQHHTHASDPWKRWVTLQHRNKWGNKNTISHALLHVWLLYIHYKRQINDKNKHKDISDMEGWSVSHLVAQAKFISWLLWRL